MDALLFPAFLAAVFLLMTPFGAWTTIAERRVERVRKLEHRDA